MKTDSLLFRSTSPAMTTFGSQPLRPLRPLPFQQHPTRQPHSFRSLPEQQHWTPSQPTFSLAIAAHCF